MYHLNLDEFEKHVSAMRSHYAFFSPLHRRSGFAVMTAFNWLSPDRLLQCTVFDDRLELVANFSDEARLYSGFNIPGKSILAKRRDLDETTFFSPRAGTDKSKKD